MKSARSIAGTKQFLSTLCHRKFNTRQGHTVLKSKLYLHLKCSKINYKFRVQIIQLFHFSSHTVERNATICFSRFLPNRKIHDNKRIFNKKTLLFAACVLLASCLAYSSTLNMYAACSSETSVAFYRTTRGYIPEDSTLHSHRCVNLKFNKIVINLPNVIWKESPPQEPVRHWRGHERPPTRTGFV
jgi:hypothetical protein